MIADKPPLKIQSHSELPVLPHGHLPKPISDWCLEIAASMDVCPTMPIAMATAILSSLLQKHFEVELSAGYRECLAYYGAVLADPGERKTSCMKALMRPVNKYANKMRNTWTAEYMMKKERAAANKQAIKQYAKDGDIEAIKRLVEDMQGSEAPKQFVLEDFTSAALANSMMVNSSMLIATDEGEFWKQMGGGFNADIGLMLRAHTAEPYTRNRKSEEFTGSIERPVLSVCVSMQPSVLVNETKDALNGQGLVARFFMAIPEPKAGKTAIKYKPFCPDKEKAYDEFMASLCQMIDDEPDEPLALYPSEGGRQCLEEFAKWCVWEQRQDDDPIPYSVNTELPTSRILKASTGAVGVLSNMRGWGSKLAGACARIACLRAACRAYKYNGQACNEITKDDACHAINYCLKMVDHTRSVGNLLAGEDWMTTSKAKAILDADGWPQEPIAVGRLANIIKEAGSSRAMIDKAIKDLVDKEHLIFVDARTVRSNTCYIKKVALELEQDPDPPMPDAEEFVVPDEQALAVNAENGHEAA